MVSRIAAEDVGVEKDPQINVDLHGLRVWFMFCRSAGRIWSLWTYEGKFLYVLSFRIEFLYRSAGVF